MVGKPMKHLLLQLLLQYLYSCNIIASLEALLAPATIYGYPGGSTTLPCPIPLSDTITDMRWYQESGYTKTVYDITGSVHKSINSNRYNASRETGALTIYNSTQQDASIYKCTVVDGDYIKDSYVTLTVRNIQVVSTSRKALAGTYITFSCSASAVGNFSSLQWILIKNGLTFDILTLGHHALIHRYSADPDTGALTITDVHRRDAGNYICTMVEDANEIVRKHIIKLEVESTNATTSVTITHMYFKQGHTFHYTLSKESVLQPGWSLTIIACVKSYNQLPNIDWYKNNTLISKTYHELSLNSAHRPGHGHCHGLTSKLNLMVTESDDGAIISVVVGYNNSVASRATLGFPLAVRNSLLGRQLEGANSMTKYEYYSDITLCCMFVAVLLLLLQFLMTLQKCIKRCRPRNNNNYNKDPTNCCIEKGLMDKLN